MKKKVREEYSLVMDTWKVQELSQKELNAKLKGGWEDEVRRWNVEKDHAKSDHQRPKWTKPKIPLREKHSASLF